MYDIKRTGFDWTDILADVAGIVAAVLLCGLAKEVTWITNCL